MQFVHLLNLKLLLYKPVRVAVICDINDINMMMMMMMNVMMMILIGASALAVVNLSRDES